jgi:glycosyltransferase involved in cell wall biosynthesis
LRLLFVSKREPQQRDLIARPYGRFHWLPVELARCGHAVTQLLVSHRGSPPATLTRDGVRISAFDPLGAGFRRTLLALEAEARAFEPDWIIGCSDAWYGWLAARLAKRTGARLAIDAYDDYESYMAWNLPLHWAWRRALRQADLVTAAGPHLARLLDRQRAGKAQTVVAPMAADPEFSPMDQANCREALGLAIDGRYVGYVGSWSATRGSDALLSAFRLARARHADLQLVVSGRPPLSVQAEPGVIATGYLPDAQMPVLLNALDVACVVTADTAFGRSSYPAKLCEAMACGIPVVASQTAPVAWMLDQQPAHLVPLDDPAVLTERILAQLDSPSAAYPARLSWAGIAHGLERALLQPRD